MPNEMKRLADDEDRLITDTGANLFPGRDQREFLLRVLERQRQMATALRHLIEQNNSEPQRNRVEPLDPQLF